MKEFTEDTKLDIYVSSADIREIGFDFSKHHMEMNEHDGTSIPPRHKKLLGFFMEHCLPNTLYAIRDFSYDFRYFILKHDQNIYYIEVMEFYGKGSEDNPDFWEEDVEILLWNHLQKGMSYYTAIGLMTL